MYVIFKLSNYKTLFLRQVSFLPVIDDYLVINMENVGQMFPDDLHFRNKDRDDNLLKAFLMKSFQMLPVPLSTRSQLLLANIFSKHSRVSSDHFRFNQQLVVEAHGMDCLQSVSLYIGKLITNEVRHLRVYQPRATGQPDRIIEHVLADMCKFLLHFI